MKKNAMLKIAAILLVAVLLTTCAISATFAKYVSADKLDDKQTARVAKWGVDVEFTGNGADDSVEMFKTEYSLNSDKVVISADTDNVMAPGTANDNALTVTVSGTPEVALTFVSDLAVTYSNWKVDTDGDGTAETDYMPVTFYLAVDGAAKAEKTLDEINTYLSTTLVNDIMGGNDFVAPGNISKTFTISWEWDYSVDADNDILDTLLGDAAANGQAATIGFTGGITVAQYGDDFAK